VAENDRGSSEEEPKAHRDEGYPALGRYLVALSGMVSLMREQMDFFAQATGSHPALKGIKGRSFGASADSIRKAYFKVATLVRRAAMLRDHSRTLAQPSSLTSV
jgi:hypothetical protein